MFLVGAQNGDLSPNLLTEKHGKFDSPTATDFLDYEKLLLVATFPGERYKGCVYDVDEKISLDNEKSEGGKMLNINQN